MRWQVEAVRKHAFDKLREDPCADQIEVVKMRVLRRLSELAKVLPRMCEAAPSRSAARSANSAFE